MKYVSELLGMTERLFPDIGGSQRLLIFGLSPVVAGVLRFVGANFQTFRFEFPAVETVQDLVQSKEDIPDWFLNYSSSDVPNSLQDIRFWGYGRFLEVGASSVEHAEIFNPTVESENMSSNLYLTTVNAPGKTVIRSEPSNMSGLGSETKSNSKRKKNPKNPKKEQAGGLRRTG